jgi:hypothetical protein
MYAMARSRRCGSVVLRGLLFFCGIAAGCLIEPPRVSAYLDPGSGSAALQLILAGLFAALFCLRLFWSRVKSLLVRIGSVLGKSDQTNDENS